MITAEGKKEDGDVVWIPTQRQERGCYEKVGVYRLHPCELAHPPASSPSRDLINADALQWRPTCIASSSLSKLNPRSLLERPPQPTFQICCCCCYCFNYIKTILFVSTLFLFYCYVCAYFLKKWCFFFLCDFVPLPSGFSVRWFLLVPWQHDDVCNNTANSIANILSHRWTLKEYRSAGLSAQFQVCWTNLLNR